MTTIAGLLMVGLLAFPWLAGADEYGRGFCAGRKAGLEQASTYVHAVFDEVKKALPTDDPMAQFLGRLFQAVPMVSFGPPLDEPIIVTAPDGLRISCPGGDVHPSNASQRREESK